MSSILTNDARTEFALLLKNAPLFLAWGSGNADWGKAVEISRSFGIGTIDLGYPHVSNIIVTDGSTTFNNGPDYSVNYQTGVLTRNPSGSIQVSDELTINFMVRPAPAAVTAHDLIAEVGRKLIVNKQFVVPSSEGDIEVETGTFALSPGGAYTPHLFIEVSFLPNEAPEASIRELGVFIRTVVTPGLPSGQLYYPAAQVVDKGKLVTLHNIDTITRNNTSRETFQLVITL